MELPVFLLLMVTTRMLLGNFWTIASKILLFYYAFLHTLCIYYNLYAYITTTRCWAVRSITKEL